MTDDSEPSKRLDGLRPQRPSQEIEAEIHRLTDALVDENITEQQRQRLEQIVTADAAAAEVYLEIMYEWGSLPNYVAPSLVDLQTSAKNANASAAQLNETMILPAVHLGDVDEDDAPLVLPSPPAITPLPARNRRWLGLVAAVGFLGFTIVLYRSMHRATPVVTQLTIPRNPAPQIAAVPPATITAVTALKLAKTGEDSVGTTLAAGQQKVVSDGAIEVTFTSGAIIVVQAPARFHVIDPNAVSLDDGRLAAHVPLAARGFRVVSPGLISVDRGTDFGIRALPTSTASEVDVFGGLVDVTGTDADGRSSSLPIRAVAGDAYRHDVLQSAAPIPVPFSPQIFSRDIDSIRRSIPMHDTGDGLTGGDPDPNWQISSAPAELNWKPRPAIVIKNPIYSSEPDTPGVKWIATDASGPHLPRGLYVFKTTFDLTGFDPSTAKIQAIATADDCIADVLVNGASTGLSTTSVSLAEQYKHTTLEIPSNRLHGGENAIEIIVRNENAPDGANTQMALKVHWAATGCTLVQR
jgi:hypothetical protein